jgi:hypothetical protein
MRPNLDTLRHEIEQHLESRGVAVFWSQPRGDAESSFAGAVHWDAESHPDYREFVGAACAAGIRLITLHAPQLTPDVVETALARLPEAELERDERRTFEARLNEMRAYEGFIGRIEMSFDHAQRTYVFEVRTDWFDELDDLVERIEYSYQDEEDENPLTGYYSNN